MPETQRLTIDETVAILRAHAFTTDEDVPGFDGDGFEPPKRRVIHCFMGFIGADWELESAIALVNESSDRGWVDNVFGHDLAVLGADDNVRRFDIRRPAK